MTMLTLDEVKNYLRVDFEEDDSLIMLLIEASKNYIRTELQIELEERFEVMPPELSLAMLLLISYWYDERTAMVNVKNRTLSTEVKYGVASILNPFKQRQL